MNSSPLTVACVFRASVDGGTSGGCYTASWVQKLKRNVARHLTQEHRFVCLTNTVVPGVECIPLHDSSWEGWWAKISLFEPGLFNGPVLYMDLDVFPTDSLQDFVQPRPNLIMLRDVIPYIKNSTIMYWDGRDERLHAIFHAFKADPAGAMAFHQYTHSLGDQGFIKQVLDKQGYHIEVWQDLLGSEGFVPFSKEQLLNYELTSGILPYKTRFVYCLGFPKFHQHPELKFIQEHWS